MPIDLTPAGGFMLSLHNVRRIIAHCEKWQELTGTDGLPDPPTSAAAKIYIHAAPPPLLPDGFTKAELAAARPIAMVSPYVPPEFYGGRPYVKSRNAHDSFVEMGRALVWFVANIPDEFIKHIQNEIDGSMSNALIDFNNQFGVLIDEISELANTEDFLSVRHIEIHEGPFIGKQLGETHRGPNIQAVLMMEWGDLG